MKDRDEYILGLRMLANLLEETPELPLPHFTSDAPSWHVWSTAAEVARVAKLIPGKLTKNDPNTGHEYDQTYFELVSDQKLGPFTLKVVSYRATVCEKVQTGEERVIVAAVKAQPKREEVRPTFEWRCTPLLAKAVS